MRVVVTGAGGYIGIPLCTELLKRGHRVVAVDRYFFGRDKMEKLGASPALEVVVEDIRRIEPGLYEGADAAIDLAGLSNDLSAEIDPDLTRQVNFDGGAFIAKVAKEAGVRRYIYSSSASVYGHGLKPDLTEEDECRPQTLYAASKLHVEGQLRALGGPAFEPVIFRSATVFGLAPRMRFDLAVNIMTLRAWKDRVIYIMGGGDQWRPFVHVRDLVDALTRGLEAEAAIVAGETFNVGDERLNLQVKQLARYVLDIIPNVQVHTIPDNPDSRTYNLCFDKIKKKLGFEARSSIHEGIVEIKQALDRGELKADDPTCFTLQWYRSLIEWQKRIDDLKLDGALL